MIYADASLLPLRNLNCTLSGIQAKDRGIVNIVLKRSYIKIRGSVTRGGTETSGLISANKLVIYIFKLNQIEIMRFFFIVFKRFH